MFAKTFRGGIHPYDGKELSKNAAITKYLPKGDLVFLMNQHIGAPAVPCVNVGDRVLVGQKIADAGGFVSAPICSSVSGTVKTVGPFECQNGDTALAVTVVNDGEYEAVEGFGAERDYKTLTSDEIKAIIKDAGIVGMGGAGFPTHVKFAIKEGVVIDHIICNAAECEPFITCDHRLMLERADDAVLGMRILLSMFPGAKGVFGVENNKPDGIASLAKACINDVDISVATLKKKYPQGGERMLISAITGRKINAKMLPADVGCIVVNYASLIAVADAVCHCKPLVSRVVTVTGDAITNPSNFEVPIGTNMAELVEAAGGFKEEPEKVIFGGPMMGAAVYKLDLPVNKATSCLLAYIKDRADQEPGECIRCGKCLSACPERLMPIKLKNSADAGDYARFEKLHGLECISCGCCTYICPAKRRLSQSITAAKNHVIAEKRKAAAKK